LPSSIDDCALTWIVWLPIISGSASARGCTASLRPTTTMSVHRWVLIDFNQYQSPCVMSQVSFPRMLDNSLHMVPPAGPKLYRLYAMMEHDGRSISQGHIRAYARIPSGQWYCFDDGTVYPVCQIFHCSQFPPFLPLCLPVSPPLSLSLSFSHSLSHTAGRLCLPKSAFLSFFYPEPANRFACALLKCFLHRYTHANVCMRAWMPV
jgi:hypothetical protein